MGMTGHAYAVIDTFHLRIRPARSQPAGDQWRRDGRTRTRRCPPPSRRRVPAPHGVHRRARPAPGLRLRERIRIRTRPHPRRSRSRRGRVPVWISARRSCVLAIKASRAVTQASCSGCTAAGGSSRRSVAEDCRVNLCPGPEVREEGAFRSVTSSSGASRRSQLVAPFPASLFRAAIEGACRLHRGERGPIARRLGSTRPRPRRSGVVGRRSTTVERCQQLLVKSNAVSSDCNRTVVPAGSMRVAPCPGPSRSMLIGPPSKAT